MSDCKREVRFPLARMIFFYFIALITRQSVTFRSVTQNKYTDRFGEAQVQILLKGAVLSHGNSKLVRLTFEAIVHSSRIRQQLLTVSTMVVASIIWGYLYSCYWCLHDFTYYRCALCWR